ncbi:MAG: two-component system, NtrC family, sensor histidine kinase PilS [Blastocatellia bacterium]|jgi:two-component system sensor histidine kinase PilS (NtrC family)|nr:two-component system, NtrC family, sensor histidine kinase PilS [Blastocatellia bacterium]
MEVATTKHFQSPLGARLWWLIGGRAAAVIVLLLVGVVFKSSALGHGLVTSLSVVAPIILTVAGLCLIYTAARLLWKNFLAQARLQFFVDVLLVSWLVWTTGNVGSPYAALYVVIISIASLFVGPRDTIITSVGSAAAFTLCALPSFSGFGPFAGPDVSSESIANTIQFVGLSDVSFLVVGLLAAKLADRQTRSDVQLAAATRSLADLRALHERIVESIRSGVITTDLRGRVFTFNAAAEEITGYKLADVRGEDASIFFGDMTRQITDSMNAAASGKVSPRFQADCLTPNGLALRLGFSIAPLSGESGETSGMVITFQDLTDIRALEETSRRQDRMAAVGRLAASIAHEIRNPLAAMRGSIQMLRSEMEGDTEQAQLMEIILRESDRLNKIVADYLNYARPQPAELKNVDIRALVADTFKLLRNSAELSPGHVLEENLPNRPAIVSGDPEQLKQVCWNIARNALKAMPEGGRFSVSLAAVDGNRQRLSFSDTGCGMSPEQVERLFEPFTSTTGGTGLGLSIVYQIIRDHSGTINVRSRLGEGTTITVELPVTR